jgi:hypothetical protein
MSTVLAQNRIMRRYAEAGATTPEKARRPEDLGLRESWIFLRLVNAGVLVECGEGRYRIDPEAVRIFVARRRRRAIVLLAVAGALLAAWLLIRSLS